MQLRALFDNNDPDQKLIPGLFVRVRIKIGKYEDAMLVPERAVSRDQAGSFVYVINEQNEAVRKNVVLGTKHEDMTVIQSGIEGHDQVIVDGIQRVRSGIQVEPDQHGQ